jgi:predicted CXXCH cytochrome family protein
MKKHLWFILAICMLFVASIAMAAPGDGLPGNGIKLTAHDLSSNTAWGPTFGDTTEQAGLDRICIYCHAPHNTLKLADAAGINYLPLWNHNVTVQTYAMYSPGTDLPSDPNHQSKAAELLVGQNRPGGVSRLCLSCHDATVATNAYGQYGASSKGAGNKFVTGAFIIGGNGDLSNHHPIGFNYTAAQSSDAGLATVDTPVYDSKNIQALLWNNNMECTTCHDVHNTGNDPLANKFLWKSDYQSGFCLTCHLKSGTGHP